MLEQYNRGIYYTIFAFSFGFVWFLFKLGGLADTTQALLSSAIDIGFSLAATILTVEILMRRLFYRQRYLLFVMCFFMAIAVTGWCTILSQLKLIGHSLGDYQRYISRSKGHYYYWFGLIWYLDQFF